MGVRGGQGLGVKGGALRIGGGGEVGDLEDEDGALRMEGGGKGSMEP